MLIYGFNAVAEFNEISILSDADRLCKKYSTVVSTLKAYTAVQRGSLQRLLTQKALKRQAEPTTEESHRIPTWPTAAESPHAYSCSFQGTTTAALARLKLDTLPGQNPTRKLTCSDTAV